MSFIAGYHSEAWRADGHEVRQVLHTYGVVPRAADVPGDYVETSLETGTGHLLLKHRTAHPLPPRAWQQDRERQTLALLGYLLAGEEHQAAPGPGLIDEAHRTQGTVLERREGEFVCVYVDGAAGSTHIINDRFGARPFYLLQTPQATFFASNLLFLCAMFEQLTRTRPDLDPLGWMQMASFTHTLGARTTLRSIDRLRPATHLTLSGGAASPRRYWRFEHRPAAGLDPDRTAEAVYEAMRTSVARRLDLVGSGLIALSGGLDSRFLAAALPEGSDVTALTFVNAADGANTAEVSAASEVARVLGLAHEVVSLERTALSKWAELAVRLTGGLVPLHHQVGTLEFIRAMQSGPRFLLGSGPGDTLAGAFPPSPLTLDPRRRGQMIRLFAHYRNHAPTRASLSLLFRHDLIRDLRGEVLSAMRESFEELGGPTPAHEITAWSMVFRQPAFTMTSPIHTHPEVTEATPFLDYAYVELMLALPAEWLYKRNFYAFMIHQCAPALRPVAVANTGRPLSGRLQRFTTRTTSREGLKGLAHALLPGPLYNRLRRRGQRRVTSFHYDLMRNDGALHAEIGELMRESPSLRTMLNAERCQRFLEQCRSGQPQTLSRRADAELLGTLATMCYTCRVLDI